MDAPRREADESELGGERERRGNEPQRTSPSMSCTLFFHFLPSSPSQSFTLSTLLAIDSASFWVSSLPMAAKIKRPFPIVDMSCPSTVTDADFTRWMTAGIVRHWTEKWHRRSCLTLHGSWVDLWRAEARAFQRRYSPLYVATDV